MKILPILTETLENAPMVKRGEYNYFIHPITDGVPELTPALLMEVTNYICEIVDNGVNAVDKIVTIESMGIPIGTALSLQTDLSLAIIRKREYGLPNEVVINQETGYSKGELYINGLNKGDRVIIVDDVISTGGTMSAVIHALTNMGVMICDIVIVVERDMGAMLLRAEGYDIQTLIAIGVDEDGVNIRSTLNR